MFIDVLTAEGDQCVATRFIPGITPIKLVVETATISCTVLSGIGEKLLWVDGAKLFVEQVVNPIYLPWGVPKTLEDLTTKGGRGEGGGATSNYMGILNIFYSQNLGFQHTFSTYGRMDVWTYGRLPPTEHIFKYQVSTDILKNGSVHHWKTASHSDSVKAFNYALIVANFHISHAESEPLDKWPWVRKELVDYAGELIDKQLLPELTKIRVRILNFKKDDESNRLSKKLNGILKSLNIQEGTK